MSDLNIIIAESDENSQIIIVDIEEFDDNLKKLIDECLIPICEDDEDVELKYVKKRLSAFLKTKSDSTVETGSIAEFFVHLILNKLGFKQEFTFFNLEERSIKKGFDGYYTFQEDEWIMESKAGDSSTKNISHSGKINDAYKDLVRKFVGQVENNPWQNAYNHAKVVGSDKSIINKIKKLKNDYVKEVYPDIKNFNIIPCSSIFTVNVSEHMCNKDIIKDIEKIIPKFDCKKIKTVCVSNKTKTNFIDYINSWEG